MSMIVDDHKKDIDLFKETGNGDGDNDLKMFANNAVPTLQQHLDSAEAIRRMFK